MIIHAQPRVYNPQKAHEYYLRTRHLHPRKKVTTYTVKNTKGKTVTLTEPQLIAFKAYADKRVSQITSKLDKLGVELRNYLQKIRDEDTKAKTKKQATPSKPTVAEKSKTTREAKKYRDAHKSQLAAKAKATASRKPKISKSTTSKAEQKAKVDEFYVKVTKVKRELKAAVAKQRELATATRNG